MALSDNPAFFFRIEKPVESFPVFFTVDVGMLRPACQLKLKPTPNSVKSFTLCVSNDVDFPAHSSIELMSGQHDASEEEVIYNIPDPLSGICPRALTCSASSSVLPFKAILLGDSDGGVALVRFPSMSLLTSHREPKSPHHSAVLKFFARADQKVLASSDGSGRLVLWHVQEESPYLICQAVLTGGHTSPCKGALLLPDGSVVSWSDDALNYWTIRTQSGIPVVSRVILGGHTSGVTGAFAVPGSEDSLLISHSDEDMAVIKWDLKKPVQSLVAHSQDVVATLLLRRSARAVTVSRELFLWDLSREAKDVSKTNVSPAGAGTQKLLDRLDFVGRAKGMELLELGEEEPETIVVWTEEPVLRLVSFPDDGSGLQVRDLQSHTAGVTGVVQRRVASEKGIVDLLTWATDRNIIYFFHEARGKYRPIVIEPEPGLRQMSEVYPFELNGKFDRNRVGVLALTDGTVWVWEVDLLTGKYVVRSVAATHNRMHILPSQTEVLMSGSSVVSYHLPSLRILATQDHGNCFAADYCGGRMVATGCTSAKVKLWNVGVDKIDKLWDGSHDGGLIQGSVHGIKHISPDLFVSWARDFNIKVWDMKTKVVTTLAAHKNDPSGVAFVRVSDLGFLASWSRGEDKLLLWKIFGGEPSRSKSVPQQPVWIASFDSQPAQVVMEADNEALRIFVSLMDGSVTFFSVAIPL
eukprot:gb/GEZN01002546.1/.p1 GENE.gb/GEZN01002546.1/~~gb/GEZN01002546.1/.p1  ORF type:complete len:783 (+),score=87.39 gb/GEZN01002546.1/:268-2349(+)